MFDFLRRLLTPKPVAATAVLESLSRWGERRWEAADTDRLTRGHWSRNLGQPINADLAERLDWLRTRCAREAANNPMVEGVVATHVTDVIGPNGPVLQVQSDSEQYNEALERLWQDWWRRPAGNPQLSGADLLRLWVRGLWLCGEFLCQIYVDREAAGPVKSRLLPLHPSRLGTPAVGAGDGSIVLGIRFSAQGKPLTYWISQTDTFGAYTALTWEYREIPAADLIHRFVVSEEDQARGFPWLSPSLREIADLRDYDAAVLLAARMAANFGVIIGTKHPDAQYTAIATGTTDVIQPGTMRTLPPGWEASQMTPQQPSTQYVDFRSERQRGIGRPVGMPLMMIRLDSSRHNYSSARFDGQTYVRQLGWLQRWLATGTLDGLVELVAREGELAGVLPARPKQVSHRWTWPVPPHVDPYKEAQAERARLENGTLTYSGALAAHGLDVESTIAQRQRDTAALADAGLPPLPTAQGRSDPSPEDDETDDENIPARNREADDRARSNGRSAYV